MIDKLWLIDALRPFHLFRTDSRITWDKKKKLFIFMEKRDVYPIESSRFSSFPLIFAEIEKQGRKLPKICHKRVTFGKRELATNNK